MNEIDNKNIGWLKFTNIYTKDIATWFVLNKTVSNKFKRLHYSRTDADYISWGAINRPEFSHITHCKIANKS